MTPLHLLSPSAFCTFLRDHGIRRFSLVYDDDTGRLVPSHPELAPLAAEIAADARDFDRHEGIFVQVGPETGVLQGAVVHRTCRGQAAGGVRFWHYATMQEYLRDGLRLARGMTHKNALAGLWWGGGKGVMARGTGQDTVEVARGTGQDAAAMAQGTGGRAADPEMRRRIYEEYGTFMTSLAGCYVTAEDVGTSPEDMAAIFSRTRFTTCIPPALGGSGNPSAPTALGVVRGMEAGLAFLGLGTLAGRSVAIQGIGHVGQALVGYLAERGVGRIVATDVAEERGAALRQAFPNLDLEVRIVGSDDATIFAEPVDIVSPNATGGILGPRTIPRIAARLVCGAANNQLEDPGVDDVRLAERGVVYLPDFLVNRMGIVNCADEQSGYVANDARFLRHLGTDWDDSIYQIAQRVLSEAREKGRTPHRITLDLAEARSFETHPIDGHRGREIIRSLAAEGWAHRS